MLREDPTNYQIISTSAELLQRATLNDDVRTGATLEVCIQHITLWEHLLAHLKVLCLVHSQAFEGISIVTCK